MAGSSQRVMANYPTAPSSRLTSPPAKIGLSVDQGSDLSNPVWSALVVVCHQPPPAKSNGWQVPTAFSTSRSRSPNIAGVAPSPHGGSASNTAATNPSPSPAAGALTLRPEGPVRSLGRAEASPQIGPRPPFDEQLPTHLSRRRNGRARWAIPASWADSRALTSM
jgi:hypothetical protein